MKLSLPAKLALVAALGLTLGGKAAFSRAAPDVDDVLYTARATDLLAAHGFRTRLERRPFATVIYGQRGACRMLVSEYSAHGTMAEPLAALAGDFGPMRYAWQGKLMEEAPKLVPLAAFLVQRELRRIGLRPKRQPITAFAASPGCDPRAIRWDALATLPA